MPHLMNCQHSESGWCLDCVKELHDERERQFEIFKWLFDHAKDTEWMTHNAAENSYCPYCINDDDWFDDQREHEENCQYVEMMKKASAMINHQQSNLKDIK